MGWRIKRRWERFSVSFPGFMQGLTLLIWVKGWHSAATLTTFPSLPYSEVDQWPRELSAADHCSIPTWSSKPSTVLHKMEAFSAPGSCQPCWKGTDSSATGTVWFPTPWSAQDVPQCSHHSSADLSKTSWLSLEPVGGHACECAALPAHFGESNANRQG